MNKQPTVRRAAPKRRTGSTRPAAPASASDAGPGGRPAEPSLSALESAWAAGRPVKIADLCRLAKATGRIILPSDRPGEVHLVEQETNEGHHAKSA